MLLTSFGFKLNILLDRKLGRFAETPFPRGEILAQLAQTREPFLRWIDELEAELLHQQIASTVG